MGQNWDSFRTVVFRSHFVSRELLLVYHDWLGHYEEDLTFGSPK